MGFFVAAVFLIPVQAGDINGSFGRVAENSEISLMKDSSWLNERTNVHINQFTNFYGRSDYGLNKAEIVRNPISLSNFSHWAGRAPVTNRQIYDNGNSSASPMENRLWFSRRSQIHIYQSINSVAGNNRSVSLKLLGSNIVHPGQSIQAAVDAAKPGSIIEVHSGSYYENVHISQPLIIRGVDAGSGLPVIDAHGHGNAIEIAADQVALYELIATNSSGPGIGEPGAGIRISSNNCTIRGIRSYKNFYGISLVDSYNNSLYENNFSNNFCGVRLYYSNNNTVEGNCIENNSYGMRLSSSHNNTVVFNIAPDNEYGIDLASSRENVIENNSLNGSSIKALKADELSTQNLISNNTGTEAKENAEVENVTTYLPHHPNQPKCRANASDDRPPNPLAKPRARPSKSSDSDDSINGWGDNQKAQYSPLGPIIQSCIDREIESLPKGQITFTPTGRMCKGVTYPVVVRISRNISTKMTQGLEKFEKVETANISVSFEMNVTLTGDSTFDILPERQETKVLPKTDFVEWTWEVTPNEPGNHTLRLVATALIYLDYGEKKVEMKKVEMGVFEKDIPVYVDQFREIKAFFFGGGAKITDLFMACLVELITIALVIHAIESIKSMRKREDERKADGRKDEGNEVDKDREDKGKSRSDKDDDVADRDP